MYFCYTMTFYQFILFIVTWNWIMGNPIEIELNRLYIGHSRSTPWHLMSRNAQQPTCRNTACRNQRMKIKHYLEEYSKWEDCILILFNSNYILTDVIRKLIRWCYWKLEINTSDYMFFYISFLDNLETQLKWQQNIVLKEMVNGVWYTQFLNLYVIYSIFKMNWLVFFSKSKHSEAKVLNNPFSTKSDIRSTSTAILVC